MKPSSSRRNLAVRAAGAALFVVSASSYETSTAHADEPPPAPAPEATPPAPTKPTKPVAPKAATKRAVPAPAMPASAPPSVTLALIAAPAGQTWRLRVENTGDVPLRVARDARLLMLDVTAPGARKAVTCVLPSAMRPSSASAPAAVLAAKAFFEESFDPRLFCFSERHAAAFVAGATVVGRFGFPAPAARGKATKPLAPPFAVTPFEGVEPRVSAAKEIAGAAITLEATHVSRAAEPAAPGKEPKPPSFTIEMRPRIDVADARDIDVGVTVVNAGQAATRVRVRPAAISFDVTGPTRATRCESERRPSAPIRELMTTLAPGAKSSTRLLLTEVCAPGTFGEAGLYTVRARVEPARLTGEGALRAADAEEIPAATPSLLRVQTSQAVRATASR